MRQGAQVTGSGNAPAASAKRARESEPCPLRSGQEDDDIHPFLDRTTTVGPGSRSSFASRMPRRDLAEPVLDSGST